MILCGEGEDDDVVADEMRDRYVLSKETRLLSNSGLLRDGPQLVGWRKPLWTSITRRAVRG